MKRLLLLLPLLIASSAAQAAPIYLRCDEKAWSHSTSIYSGNDASIPPNRSKIWKDIPVVIYPERGSGQVWSSNYSLVKHPDKYQLKIRRVVPSESEVTSWTFNRQTLEMKYSSSLKIYIGGLKSSESDRESAGTCKIAPVPANNQI